MAITMYQLRPRSHRDEDRETETRPEGLRQAWSQRREKNGPCVGLVRNSAVTSCRDTLCMCTWTLRVHGLEESAGLLSS